MNRILFFSILLVSFIWRTEVLSLPQGSPNRCQKENWAEIDDLLPSRSENGGYPHLLNPIDQKIAKITPDQMLQSVVDHLLTFCDFCGHPVAGVGGWEDLIGTNLCERLALYNVTHDQILALEQPSLPAEVRGRLMFSPEDLVFLQSVFKACRPTTNRWWNYPLITHVSFSPTPEEYEKFAEIIGTKRRGK